MIRRKSHKKKAMKIGFYKIEIPEGWVVKDDQSATSIFNPQGFGAIQISSFMAPENYEIILFDELYDFVSESINITESFEQYKNIEEINCGLLLDNMIDGNREWLFAILNSGQKILLVTYNSEIEDFLKEHDTVLGIINGITFSLS